MMVADQDCGCQRWTHSQNERRVAQVGQYTAHQEFHIDVFSVGAGGATGANPDAPAGGSWNEIV